MYLKAIAVLSQGGGTTQERWDNVLEGYSRVVPGGSFFVFFMYGPYRLGGYSRVAGRVEGYSRLVRRVSEGGQHRKRGTVQEKGKKLIVKVRCIYYSAAAAAAVVVAAVVVVVVAA